MSTGYYKKIDSDKLTYMKPLRYSLIGLFILFIVANAAFLDRVPGLLGDEGSEGQNVYELLQKDSLTIVGERSYIGPLIDYVRVPYVALFGYTALALRMLMLTASCFTFFFAYSVLRRLFGEDIGTIALVICLFSPIFLLQQRIGWAITLNIFFFWLVLYCLMSQWKHKWLLSGLAGGIGLSNDIIFFPTLAAVMICSAFAYLFTGPIRERALSLLVSLWLIAVGFIAGFGTQFAVLLLFQDDQGSRKEVAAQFTSRLQDFPSALPLYLSGSSYVARYTGVEFSPSMILGITSVLGALVVLSFFHAKRLYTGMILIGLFVHGFLVLYMIDRFNLRYFALLSIVVWLLAGIGLGTVLKRFLPAKVLQFTPAVLAVLLMVWTTHTTLIPFLHTGGSLQEFSLGNRNDKASAFVDIRPLVACMRGRGVAYSPSQDIYDRLQYLGHEYPDLLVADGEHKHEAQWTISYKKPENAFVPDSSSVCPDIPFFKVVAR